MPGTVGGSQRMMITFTKFLDPKEYKVKVVITQRQVGGIVDFIPKHFDIIHLKIRNILDFPVTRMVNLIKKEKADFLFSSIFYLNFRVLVAGKQTGTPVILRNDNYASKVLNGFGRFCVRRLYKWAKVVIMQQEEMRDEFRRMFNFPDEKMIVIHNPIDEDTILERSKAPSPYPLNNAINYLWVARFNRQKAQDVLAQAFVKMHDRLPNAHLWFVGRYHDQQEFFDKVKMIVDDAGLTDYVHYVGHDSNPYRWMANCDCFVLPSRFEGLPNTLVEALYLGRPSVSTRSSWLTDVVIKDGQNGYRVEIEDVDGLAEAMLKAVKIQNASLNYKPGSAEEFCPLFT